MLTMMQRGLEANQTRQRVSCIRVAMLTMMQRGLEAVSPDGIDRYVVSRNAHYDAEGFRRRKSEEI